MWWILIAYYKDTTDELILHWGIGKRVPGEWTSPDDRYLPKETKRWTDGKACQTKFLKCSENPFFRTIHIDFQWIQEIEPAVKSMSYVLLE